MLLGELVPGTTVPVTEGVTVAVTVTATVAGRQTIEVALVGIFFF